MRSTISVASNGLLTKSLAPIESARFFRCVSASAVMKTIGQVAVGRQQRGQLVEHAEAVEVGHVQVEQHQIGPVLLEQRPGVLRLRRGDDALEPGAAEQPVDDVDVLDLVVDREDARLGPRELRHVRRS